MLRLLLLGLMLVGFATGLHRQWLVVDWVNLPNELSLPAPDEAEPLDFSPLIIGDQDRD